MPIFSNQRLRYQRRSVGLVHEMGMPAHRALPDAYVTAHHLRDMSMRPRPTGCWRGARSRACCCAVPAGADRGKALHDLGDAALRVLLRDRDADVRFCAETELRRRDDAPSGPRAYRPTEPRLGPSTDARDAARSGPSVATRTPGAGLLGARASSIHAGAWSLALSSPLAARLTPVATSRPARSGLRSR